MAGVGNIGGRIHLSRSPTQTPKKTGKRVSGSREILCHSIESLSEQSELHQLFPPRRGSSIDVDGYGAIQQISDYREECLGLPDFLGRTIDLLFSTVFVKLLLFLLSALPVSMLVVGSTYKSDCPKEPKLPLYLLVGGGFGLLKIVFLFWRQRRLHDYELLDEKSDYDEESEDIVLSRFVRLTNAALTAFLLIWFAFGNYWFYSTWKPNFKQPLHAPNNWCHGTLFWYFFYQLIASYVVTGIFGVTLISILFFYCCGWCKKNSGVV